MTKTLLAALSAGLALSACATRPEPVSTVFLTSGADPHAFHALGGRGGVVVLRPQGARGPVIINGRYIDATRMARLARPDPEALARLRRDAEALRADARRRGEIAGRQGEAARLQGEAARARGEEIRREAQRLRELCERGQVQCEIIITD